MLDRMIDIHCHILPNVDDGPKKIEDSIEMVKKATQQGITEIIATPHYIPGEIEYGVEEVLCRLEELQERIDSEGLNCTIYSGMELYLSPELIAHIKKKKILTLANSNYLLVEFPSREMSPNLINLLYEIKILGYIPIIAHPERNAQLLKDISLVSKLQEHGALLQVNAASIIGDNGKEVQKLAINLIQKGLVSFVSSDAHSVDRRPVCLRPAFDYLKGKINTTRLSELFCDDAKKVIENKKVYVESKKDFKVDFLTRMKQLVSFTS